MELANKSESENEESKLLEEQEEEIPLTKRQKIGYGVSDFSNKTFESIKGFYFNAFDLSISKIFTKFFYLPKIKKKKSFLLQVAGLPPVLAANILLVSNIFDAFNDPLLGYLNDKTTRSVTNFPHIMKKKILNIKLKKKTKQSWEEKSVDDSIVRSSLFVLFFLVVCSQQMECGRQICLLPGSGSFLLCSFYYLHAPLLCTCTRADR